MNKRDIEELAKRMSEKRWQLFLAVIGGMNVLQDQRRPATLARAALTAVDEIMKEVNV